MKGLEGLAAAVRAEGWIELKTAPRQLHLVASDPTTRLEKKKQNIKQLKKSSILCCPLYTLRGLLNFFFFFFLLLVIHK